MTLVEFQPGTSRSCTPQYGIGRIISIDGAGPNRKGKDGLHPGRRADLHPGQVAAQDGQGPMIRLDRDPRKHLYGGTDRIELKTSAFDLRDGPGKVRDAPSGREYRPCRHPPPGPWGFASPTRSGRRPRPRSAAPTGSRSTSARRPSPHPGPGSSGSSARRSSAGSIWRWPSSRRNRGNRPGDLRPHQVTFVPGASRRT